MFYLLPLLIIVSVVVYHAGWKKTLGGLVMFLGWLFSAGYVLLHIIS